MNNKGFTLIELVATIALLAVISIISFLSINSIIKKNKVNDCNILINNIKTATKEYVSDNRYNVTFINSINNEDNKLIVGINANDLISGNYLSSPIINPITEKTTSNISIRIELNKDYTVKEVEVSGLNCSIE